MATTTKKVIANSSLSSTEVAFYRSEGYLVVRSVFSKDEVQELGDDVGRICRDRAELIHVNNLRVRFKSHIETKEPIFEVFDPISDLSSVARRMTEDNRLLDRLHALYQEPACLFKDKLIYKPPGADGASLHQDWIGWPGFPESFLTVLVAIDPFTFDDGATLVYPRMHSAGYLSPIDGKHHQLEHENMHTTAVPLILEPGDVAIFSCFTPHYSRPNRSQHSRRGYFISYNALSDGGLQFGKHYEEFHHWIRERYPTEKRPQMVFE